MYPELSDEEHCRLVGITWDGGQGGFLGLAKGLDVVAGERSVLENNNNKKNTVKIDFLDSGAN